MQIYRVGLRRQATIIETATVDVTAPDEFVARSAACDRAGDGDIAWEFDHQVKVAGTHVTDLDVIADGNEKISPTPQD